jgi:hypothetical protein
MNDAFCTIHESHVKKIRAHILFTSYALRRGKKTKMIKAPPEGTFRTKAISIMSLKVAAQYSASGCPNPAMFK